MSKRKTNKPRKSDAEATGIPKPASTPKRAVSSVLSGSEGQELQATPRTETRLPELPDQEIDSPLPPVLPPELELNPVPSSEIDEQTPAAALLGARAEAEPLVRAAPAAAGMASSSPRTDSPSAGPLTRPLMGPSRAIAGLKACQELFMEMTRENLDFAASLASMRSPLDLVGVATKFADRQLGVYGRFSNTVVDIAAGRQEA